MVLDCNYCGLKGPSAAACCDGSRKEPNFDATREQPGGTPAVGAVTSAARCSATSSGNKNAASLVVANTCDRYGCGGDVPSLPSTALPPALTAAAHLSYSLLPASCAETLRGAT